VESYLARGMAHDSQSLVDLGSLERRGDCGWVRPHLHLTVIAGDEGVKLHRARCSCRESGYEEREPTPAPKLVFVEQGAFWRRTATSRALLDAGFAYFQSRSSEEEFAHPNDGGDVCTLVRLSVSLTAEIMGGEPQLPERPAAIDARTHRAFRSLIVEARNGIGSTWVERGISLFGELAMVSRTETHNAPVPRARPSHKRLADNAREALIADSRLGLVELARIVECSPFHLSRVFRRETDTTISEYRLRLRVREALARISAGEQNLARLAIELGFSDHSHLTRLLVRELGETPTAIRRSSA
jgi:AraC-like DNA-binding protein